MSNYPDGFRGTPHDVRASREDYENHDPEAADDAEHWEAFEDVRKAYLTTITAIQARMGKESAKDLSWYIAGESDTYGDDVAARIEECNQQRELGWELEG